MTETVENRNEGTKKMSLLKPYTNRDRLMMNSDELAHFLDGLAKGCTNDCDSCAISYIITCGKAGFKQWLESEATV